MRAVSYDENIGRGSRSSLGGGTPAGLKKLSRLNQKSISLGQVERDFTDGPLLGALSMLGADHQIIATKSSIRFWPFLVEVSLRA